MEAPREPLTDLPSSPHGPRALRVVTVGLVVAVVAFVVVVGFLSVEAVRRPDVGACQKAALREATFINLLA